MKLLVTGGTGFVGSHFVQLALARGLEVVALRRPGSVPRITLQKQPVWIDCEIDSVPTNLFEGVSCVVHLAAHSVNAPYDTYERCHYWNVLAPLRMMETSERAGVKDWVVAGSCFEYGESGTRYEAIPVDAPLEPLGAYSTSKAAASVALSGFARDHDFKFSWHRIFHVYGPGEAPSRFWPSLVRAAQDGTDLEMSEGMQVRDFVPVEEVARQLLLACHQRPEPGNPVFLNLGTGKALTLREFAEAEWKRLGAKGHLRIGAKPMRPNEVMRFVPQL